jgi:hypothetical protein
VSTKNLSRRALLASGAKLTLLGAFCATVGGTILAACVGSNDDIGSSHGSGSGSGSGYGYGYGYGCGYGGGYGYGYGYGC